MPLFDLKIKVRSPWLGNKATPARIRCFIQKHNELVIDVAQWQWKVKEAAEDLHVPSDVALDSLILPATIRKPAIVPYVRKFTQNDQKREEMFESIREGAVLTMPIAITSEPESALHGNKKRSLTHGEARAIFDHIGKIHGLSPWGNNFGYGRFMVLSFTLQ